MSDELKPCPFCGREQHLCPEEIPYTEQLHECGSCNVISYDWNTRPIEDALQTRIAELEAENERLSQLLHDEMSQLEIATDLGNKRWAALNKIYEERRKG